MKPSDNNKQRDDWGVRHLLVTHSLLLAIVLTTVLVCSCTRSPERTVTVYAAQDQVYSEPLLNEFTRQTGIRVRAVYDSEAVKTVGLAQRLLAEREHPQCDVFWGNEELRTRQLGRGGVFRETNGWAAFGFRSRRIVINTNLLPLAKAPQSLVELTNQVWQRRVALAYPLFGTTATHFLALRQRWGAEAWERWCRALTANQPFVVEGNSSVVKLVGRGEAWIGLTDSDDIAAGLQQGLPLVALPLNADTLLIPNTVAVTRNAPHPESAQQLFLWLQKPEVLQRLVEARALEGPWPEAQTFYPPPQWDGLLDDLAGVTEILKTIFLR